METILEHYGSSLLQILGGVSILAAVAALLQPGGSVQLWVVRYFEAIAGYM